MNLRNTNIILFFAVALIFIFSIKVNAQSDSISENYFNSFQQNLNELSELYCFSDSEFYPGKYNSAVIENFSEEFHSLNFSLFLEISEKSSEYFQFFNSLSTVNKKNLVRLFYYYEKDFEQILKNANLPIELKYLAPALSAMNSKAISSAGETGVWQLTHFQAVLNGGEVNRLVDERMNVLHSTQMAASQLKQNFEIFNVPELAITAFLCGNTKVKNAIYSAGENADLTTIINFLPKNVSNSIAAFQAMAVFLNSNRFEHSFEPLSPEINPNTVLVRKQLHFQQIENVIGISVSQLGFLNPQYKFSIVPGNEIAQKLVIPDGYKDDFILWNDSIFNSCDSSLFQILAQKIEYPPAPNRQYLGEPVKDLEIEGKTKIQYRIKTGDVLGIIAEDYDVRVADLKYWNNIYNERRIQAGQKIDIFVPDEQADYYQGLEKQTAENSSTNKNVIEQFQNNTLLKVYEQFNTQAKLEHVVKSGESPFVIAKNYDGVTPELILEWNNIDDPRKIQIGQKLIIYPQK